MTRTKDMKASKYVSIMHFLFVYLLARWLAHGLLNFALDHYCTYRFLANPRLDRWRCCVAVARGGVAMLCGDAVWRCMMCDRCFGCTAVRPLCLLWSATIASSSSSDLKYSSQAVLAL
jgi:hypothetical protein